MRRPTARRVGSARSGGRRCSRPSSHTASDTSRLTGLSGVLDEGLLEQTDVGEELLDLAGHHLLDHLRRLAAARRLRRVDAGAPARSRPPARPRGSRSAGWPPRSASRDRLTRPLEVVRAGDEVGLAVHFDQHADLAAGVDVRCRPTRPQPSGRRASPPPRRSLLAQVDDAPSRRRR